MNDTRDFVIALLVCAFTAMFWLAFPELMVPYGLYVIGGAGLLWLGGHLLVKAADAHKKRKARRARLEGTGAQDGDEGAGPRNLIGRKRVITALVLGNLTAIPAVWFTFTGSEQFSTFGAAYGAAVFGFTALAILDAVFLPSIDLMDELHKRNKAIGLAFLGYCIVVAALISKV